VLELPSKQVRTSYKCKGVMSRENMQGLKHRALLWRHSSSKPIVIVKLPLNIQITHFPPVMLSFHYVVLHFCTSSSLTPGSIVNQCSVAILKCVH